MTIRPTRPTPAPRSVWVTLHDMRSYSVNVGLGSRRYDLHRPRKAKKRKGWTSTDARCLKLGRGRKR